ncbi:MAG TPA: hypothetical protein VN729_07555 [Ktedonobacteraceae bacterium]|nr:hypothetical protein [Ktedonobacteraceae bacterium]
MPPFARQASQTLKPETPVALQPDLAHIRSTKWISAILIGVCLLYFGMFTFTRLIVAPPVSGPWYFFIFALILFGALGIPFYLEHCWKSLEAKRQAAVREDERLLAFEQPAANAEALQVPVTIVSRFSRTMLLVFGLPLTLLAVIAGNGFFLLGDLSRESFSFASLWPWLLAITIAIMGIMALQFVVLWRQRTTVIVCQDCIQTRRPNGHMDLLLYWRDARLFACYRQPYRWSKGWVITYELASSYQVVRWKWVQKNDPLRIDQQPILSYEEHQAQMRALCSLVAAKTGLPLYDLDIEQFIR